jgi:hypothetical protein
MCDKYEELKDSKGGFEEIRNCFCTGPKKGQKLCRCALLDEIIRKGKPNV